MHHASRILAMRASALALVATLSSGCWFVVDDFEDAPSGAAGASAAGAGGAGQGGRTGGNAGAGAAGDAAGAAGQGGAGQGGASGSSGAGGASGAGGGGCTEGTVLGCHDDVRLSLCHDGQPTTQTCPAENPKCSQGLCVACLADTDCPTPADCTEVSCSPEHTCKTSNAAEGKACGETFESKVCNGKGACGDCFPSKPFCSATTVISNCDSQGAIQPGSDCATTGQPVCQAGACAGVVQMVAGQSHTCALIKGGDVYCWGANDKAQLGLGSGEVNKKKLRPTRVPGLTDVTRLTTQSNHTCALTENQEVWCWGNNSMNQAATGSDVYVTEPRQVAGSFKDISAGFQHTCGVLPDGTVSCWGNNQSGQCAQPSSGTTLVVSQPTPVAGITGATQVGAGGGHTCIVNASEQHYCWGSNTNIQLGKTSFGDGSITPVLSFDATGTKVAGGKTAFGPQGQCVYHYSPQAGDFVVWGANTTDKDPTEIHFNSYAADPFDMFLGDTAQATVFHASQIQLYGYNVDGRICPTKTEYASPKTGCTVNELALVKGVTIGGGHTCAWQDNGLAWCWGVNSSGQLGINTSDTEKPTPTPVAW